MFTFYTRRRKQRVARVTECVKMKQLFFFLLQNALKNEHNSSLNVTNKEQETQLFIY